MFKYVTLKKGMGCIPSGWHRDLCLLSCDPQTVVKAAEVFKSSTQDPFEVAMHHFYHVPTRAINNTSHQQLAWRVNVCIYPNVTNILYMRIYCNTWSIQQWSCDLDLPPLHPCPTYTHHSCAGICQRKCSPLQYRPVLNWTQNFTVHAERHYFHTKPQKINRQCLTLIR